MNKKIMYTKEALTKVAILSCPICHTDLELTNNTLKCKQGHCFDLAKKGYMTLLKKSKRYTTTLYDEALFKNRRAFIESGFYQELETLIVSWLKNEKLIVDMGCGEGSYDKYILEHNQTSYIIGLDLAKAGINLASDYVANHLVPIIADLNDMPIKDHSVDLILNILSPANEEEMSRILKKDGVIIKVTPKQAYLQELRQAFKIKAYENELVMEQNIKKHYTIIKQATINEVKVLDDDALNNLIKMTPLTKYYDQKIKLDQITIALNVYMLKIK